MLSEGVKAEYDDHHHMIIDHRVLMITLSSHQILHQNETQTEPADYKPDSREGYPSRWGKFSICFTIMII